MTGRHVHSKRKQPGIRRDMKAIEVTYKGRRQTLPQWAREYGLKPHQLYNRYIKQKWDFKKALTAPAETTLQTYEYKGKRYTVTQLTEMHGGISLSSMRERLKKMSVEEAMETPNTRPKAHTYGGDKKIKAEQQKAFKPRKPPLKEPDITKCRTCQYRGKISGFNGAGVCCDYIGVMGHMRPCPPGKDCTVYVKGPSLVRKERLRRAGILVRE